MSANSYVLVNVDPARTEEVVTRLQSISGASVFQGDVTLDEARYFLKRDYVAELGWCEKGQSENPWRNKIDGFYWAVRTTQHGSSLQEVMDKVVQIRHTNDGSQYPFVDVTVTSHCATCMGNRQIQKRWGSFSTKKCPGCKGKDTKQKELTIRL